MNAQVKTSLSILISPFILVGGLAASNTSTAANFYIATNGNDANPGTLAAPLKTIAKVQYKMKPGDTAFVRGGVYVQTVRFDKSGTALAPLKIRAYQSEKPVLDGQRKLAANWGSMVNLAGNYIEMDGFEIKNGLGQGVILSGHHNALRNSNVHEHAERGVLASGDYSIVEYTRVWGNIWYNCMLSTCPPTKYPNGGSGTGLSAGRDKVDGLTQHAVLRGNTVYNNWGEGLSTYESDGTLLEGNTVYDNYKVNIYVADSTNVMVRGNLAYVSDNPYVQRAAAANIGMSDELGKPTSRNITIINNLVRGGGQTLAWWGDPDFPAGKMNTVLIAHNTLVDAQNTSKYAGSVNLRDGAHVAVRFQNNIVTQNTVAGCIKVAGGDIVFSSNLWSKLPIAAASAWNDVVLDPQLQRTGSALSGELKADYFKLKSASPAINEADTVSTILDDYFGNLRDATPDIGGHEF